MSTKADPCFYMMFFNKEKGYHQVLLGAKNLTRGEHPITLLIFAALNLKVGIRLQIEIMQWIQIMTFMFIILIKRTRI